MSIISFEQDTINSDKEMANPQRAIKFGVPYLDNCCKGIYSSDLIAISAATGIGKTELGIMIGCNVAEQSKKVLYFALELEKGELASRVNYRYFARYHYESSSNLYVDYESFVDGEHNDLYQKYKSDIWEDTKQLYSNLDILYKDDIFYPEDLYKELIENKDNYDLFLVDHLSFIDTFGTNELKEQEQIMKRIKSFCNEFKKPVIMICHLRKKDRKLKTFMPTEEDIAGTKHIPNACSKVILLAPDWETKLEKPYLCPTFIRVSKNRKGMHKTRFAYRSVFDARFNEYNQKGDLLHVIGDCMSFKEVEYDKLPAWCDDSIIASEFEF